LEAETFSKTMPSSDDPDPDAQVFEDLVSEALVWDSHAGVFPDPDADLDALQAWRRAGVNYVSMNVGFDVIDWQMTLRTLAAYRCPSAPRWGTSGMLR
jgi:hypothetical protein